MKALPSLAVLLVAAASACGGSSGDSDDASPTPPDTVASTQPNQTTPVEPEDTSQPDSAPPSTESEPTSPPPSTDPGPPSELADIDALADLMVTTPASGNGERPLLSWEPVDGAAAYVLTLSEPTGVAYWAWSGSISSTWLGGQADEPPPDSAGPILVEELILRVVALDEAGSIIAASEPTPIEP